MVVKAHSINHRVGLYQLIIYGLFAVPQRGKTGPPFLSPTTTGTSSYADSSLYIILKTVKDETLSCRVSVQAPDLTRL